MIRIRIVALDSYRLRLGAGIARVYCMRAAERSDVGTATDFTCADAAVEKLGATHSLSLQAAQKVIPSDMGRIASHGMRPIPRSAPATSQTKLRKAAAPEMAKSRM